MNSLIQQKDIIINNHSTFITTYNLNHNRFNGILSFIYWQQNKKNSR